MCSVKFRDEDVVPRDYVKFEKNNGHFIFFVF